MAVIMAGRPTYLPVTLTLSHMAGYVRRRALPICVLRKSHGLTHLTGTKTDGTRVDLWFRSTTGLRRTAAGWQITHEHDSTPFYMDGSDRAATDLRP
jgi:hypothetical protein